MNHALHKAMGSFAIVFWLVSSSAAMPSPTQSQAGSRDVEGMVLDTQGLPITGAQITLTEKQGSTRKTAVSSEARFRLDGLEAGEYEVTVEAAGFEPQTVTADLRSQTSTSVEIRLAPARFSQELVVTATRTEQRIGDIPASISVLRGEDIRESSAVVADDVLKKVPSFSLFRRTSSLAAHPTAQGVSLRGVGPSGVSRTLVLLDNIPFNDPFGGWVYWTRVPLMSVDRIEIVDGPNSSVYGNYAMGGVINIMTSRPEPRTLVLKPQFGGRRNPRLLHPGETVWDGLGSLDFLASDVWKNFGAAVEGSFFNTNGYPTIPEKDFDGSVLRGPADTKATVNYQNISLKLDYSPSDRFNTFFRGGYFSEDRSNAKTCRQSVILCDETNDTLWKFVSGGVRVRLPGASDLQARVFANFETFHSSFLAIPAANPLRSIGRLSLLQTVPTKDSGFMAQWSKPASRHFFTVGTDWRWVDGDSNEASYNQTTGFIQLQRVSGGSQQSLGVFAQDVISVTTRFQVTLSARLDHWRNYDAHNLETGLNANNRPNCANVSDPATQPCLSDKENTVGSPRIGALYRLSDRVTVWGAMNWAFRAPSLNELYRQFGVGNVITQANAELGPERLVGGETGLNVSPIRNLTWRTTWFINRVKNPVSNVTLATPANRRQRQNLGRTRIYGIQSDIEYRFRSDLRLSGGYLYDMATVREYAPDPTLVGRFLPQVPRHRGSVQLMYANSRYATLGIDAQFMSSQFEDPPILPFDQNQLRLPGYGVVNMNASRTISTNVEAFFGIQNLLNRTFYVQRNPTTIGAPRLVTGGLRISLRGR